MRVWADNLDSEVKEWLRYVGQPNLGPNEVATYRHTMLKLGAALVKPHLYDMRFDDNILVVSDQYQADWLARGAINQIKTTHPHMSVNFACFWMHH